MHVYLCLYLYLSICISRYVDMKIMTVTTISISIFLFCVIFSIATSLITILILVRCLPRPTTFVSLVVRCLLCFGSFICSISIHEVRPILSASILSTLIFSCISLIGLLKPLTFVLPIFQP